MKAQLAGLSARRVAVAVLLAAQLAAIGYARLSPTRYFCWAPYDELSVYDIRVERDGVRLSAVEIADRYRLPVIENGYSAVHGRENRAIAHVLSVIERYERSYGRRQQVRVWVDYRTHGYRRGSWQYPVEAASASR